MLLVEFALFVAPAALLVLTLALGHYPGERILRSAAARPRPCLRAPARIRPQHHYEDGLARGTLLIARALAERAPPPVTRPV